MEASKCDMFLTVVGASITIFRKLPRRRKPTSEMGQALRVLSSGSIFAIG